MTQKESGDVKYFLASPVIPYNSGSGIKLGAWKETEPETAAYGWRDITSQIEVRGTGPTDPDWAQIGATAFYAYRFALNDLCWMAFHIPHDIVPGSDVHFHTHWLTNGTSTNKVSFEYTYAYAKGFNQAVFDFALAESPLVNAGVVTAKQSASGTAYRHMVAETDAVSIPDLTEPDGIIYVRVKRITNGSPGGPDNADSVFVLTSDIHYQSTNMATINKAPGFYGT